MILKLKNKCGYGLIELLIALTVMSGCTAIITLNIANTIQDAAVLSQDMRQYNTDQQQAINQIEAELLNLEIPGIDDQNDLNINLELENNQLSAILDQYITQLAQNEGISSNGIELLKQDVKSAIDLIKQRHESGYYNN